MKRFSVLLVATTVLLGACGGAQPDADLTPIVVPDEAAPIPPTTGTAPGPAGEADLAAFVAALEDVLEGTIYEGQAVEAPEVFVATGVLFCEEMTAGDSPDDVTARYVEELAGVTMEQAPEDDLVLAGSILGAGVVTLCPEHMDTVVASS